ncbi:hypothetical protein BMAGB8_1387 [Burkholderia mallei GB8 horse 4]|nr:hypothetical protein BMAGB8_1387 [Burkholderia mallei GB8 horse 4]
MPRCSSVCDGRAAQLKLITAIRGAALAAALATAAGLAFA